MGSRIIVADVFDGLAQLPDESVQCVVTSPPYWALRDYGVPGQMGLEPTLGEHIATMVKVFAEVRRVLRPDGTLWLNYGDSYAASVKGSGGTGKSTLERQSADAQLRSQQRQAHEPVRLEHGLKQKDLVGMPWRIAFALQADGWWLRSEITWCKPSPMPESVTDRPTVATEKLFLLTKSPRYFYDADAVRTALRPKTFTTYGTERSQLGNDALGAVKSDNWARDVPVRRPRTSAWPSARSTAPLAHPDGQAEVIGRYTRKDKQRGHGRRHAGFNDRWDAMSKQEQQSGGANLRNWWVIAPEGFPEAHFATFPTALVEPCIAAGTSEKGCCAECGAAITRTVERTHYGSRAGDGDRLVEGFQRNRMGGQKFYDNEYEPPRTTGWEATCPHDAPTIPCMVLDPFAGSGTVGVVAGKLGRDFIGIELNPKYAAMAERRIEREGRPAETAPLKNMPDGWLQEGLGI